MQRVCSFHVRRPVWEATQRQAGRARCVQRVDAFVGVEPWHQLKISPMHLQITIAIASFAERASRNVGIPAQICIGSRQLEPLALPLPITTPHDVMHGHGSWEMSIGRVRDLLEAVHHSPLKCFKCQVLSLRTVCEVTAADDLAFQAQIKHNHGHILQEQVKPL